MNDKIKEDLAEMEKKLTEYINKGRVVGFTARARWTGINFLALIRLFRFPSFLIVFSSLSLHDT
jgi:hypothetical protein